VQNPHPPIYMSGSSPESGVFAAQARVSLGLAVTTVPRATKAAELYRATARENGWEPTPDNILYRLSFHVAETDAQAVADYEESKKYPQRLSPIALNVGLERTVASTGYYGTELDKNSARNLRAAGLQDRIDAGQVLIGSPETVIKQAKVIHETLGPGVLDLNSAFQIGERTTQSVRLFGEKVLPALHAM
jgi:alkanesulfonate monooxygenase SsuD/methylene tetrahydromethanopterin reductase-like flavin-dependent oxidoreductase (luciferase family)